MGIVIVACAQIFFESARRDEVLKIDFLRDVMAFAGIVLLCVSGVVMWFKRRPAGGVGVPPLPAQRRALVAVTAMLVVGGVVFPLVGVSMVVLAAVDACVVRWGRRV